MIGRKSTTKKRFIVEQTTVRGISVYLVIDTLNEHWAAVRDCLLWAEHKADELNKQAAAGETFIGPEKPEKD